MQASNRAHLEKARALLHISGLAEAVKQVEAVAQLEGQFY